MNNVECESCLKRKTMYCPNSFKCYVTKDKPYWQNRIMLLEENKELHNKIEISIGILKTWKDFCEVKRKYCVGKDKEHWNYCIEKLEVLEEVLKGSDVDE